MANQSTNHNCDKILIYPGSCGTNELRVGITTKRAYFHCLLPPITILWSISISGKLPLTIPIEGCRRRKQPQQQTKQEKEAKLNLPIWNVRSHWVNEIILCLIHSTSTNKQLSWVFRWLKDKGWRTQVDRQQVQATTHKDEAFIWFSYNLILMSS